MQVIGWLVFAGATLGATLELVRRSDDLLDVLIEGTVYALMAIGGLLLARSRVVVDRELVTVVNPLRTYRFRRDEVMDVRVGHRLGGVKVVDLVSGECVFASSYACAGCSREAVDRFAQDLGQLLHAGEVDLRRAPSDVASSREGSNVN